MKLTVEPWGTFGGEPVQRFTIADTSSGAFTTITDLGATLLRVVRPNKQGKLIDLALTQETAEELITRGENLGATVGRVANRIANGEFELDGIAYTLARNDEGRHHIHGGIEAFHKKIWQVAKQQQLENEVILGFRYVSPNKEEGYPGTLVSDVTFHFEPNKIWWAFEATTDKPTIVNLTNHAYWTLEGLDTIIDDQEIEVAASTYFPIDEYGLPTDGKEQPVESALDMRTPRKFSDIFKQFGDVDNNFFLDEAKAHEATNNCELYYCAKITSEKTGIGMVIHTTDPCVQVYTANNLAKAGTTNGGHPAVKHGAFCLETQKPPNAINYPKYRDLVILRPGESYYHKTVHEFILASQ